MIFAPICNKIYRKFICNKLESQNILKSRCLLKAKQYGSSRNKVEKINMSQRQLQISGAKQIILLREFQMTLINTVRFSIACC